MCTPECKEFAMCDSTAEEWSCGVAVLFPSRLAFLLREQMHAAGSRYAASDLCCRASALGEEPAQGPDPQLLHSFQP